MGKKEGGNDLEKVWNKIVREILEIPSIKNPQSFELIHSKYLHSTQYVPGIALTTRNSAVNTELGNIIFHSNSKEGQ